MRYFCLTLGLLIPVAGYAEVADKMPSLVSIWLISVFVSTALTVGIRWSLWTNIPGCLVALIFAYDTFDILADPALNSAVQAELRNAYAMSLYGSIALVISGIVAGNLLYRKRH